MKFIFLVFLTLLLSPAPSLWGGFKRINQPNPKDPMAVQIYRLDNGLTVYLTENHEAPRFESEIAVRAGSKHDPADATGLAHYLEHMLFKGTQRIGTLDYDNEKSHLDRISNFYEKHFAETNAAKRAALYEEINKESQLAARFAIPNEIDKLYKAMGESGLNAHTYHEETVYKVGLPANRLSHWAIIESERFKNPVFRLFQPELEIVYEEKNRTLDSKEQIISYAVNKQLFKKHPYGQQSTIGEVEHLKNPSLKHMYDFYRAYYVPNNMAILLSGDFDPAAVIRLIDRHFGAWENKSLPQPKTWTEAPLRGPERVTVKYQGEEYVLLAFRTVGRTEGDSDAIELADMILDNSSAGLINLNLNQQQKVRQAGSYPELNNDYGAHYFWGIPKKGQALAEVEQLILTQVDLVKRGEFEDWIIPAIITDFKKRRKLQLESNVARVALLRASFLSLEDWDRTVDKITRMEKLTKADVIRVAKKYYGTNYVAGYRLDEQHEIPSIAKPEFEKISIDPTRQSAFVKEVAALPVEEIQPAFVVTGKDYRKEQTEKGITLYHCRNPLNDLFTLKLTIEIGSHHDPKLPVAAQLLDKSGAGQYSAEDLKKEWYKLGTDFSIGAGANQTVISISGLGENFLPSIQLLVTLLQSPATDAETLQELKKIIFVQREDSKKDYRSIASALYQFNRYGPESSFLRTLSNPAIEKLTAEELHSVIRNLLKYRHTVTYAGALPADEVLATLKRTFRYPETLQAPPPYKFLKVATVPQNRIYLFNKEMAQAQVRIEFGDGVFEESRNSAVQLYNDYFSGGMAGIVFQELREARALAYSVHAVYSNGDRKGEENVMVGMIGCQTDKTAEALDAFIGLLDQLPVSPERFRETRESLVNRYRTSKLGFREILDAVIAWEHLGVPVDPRKERFEKIQQADLDLVRQFHESRLKNRPKLISIVGDQSKIDLTRLKQQGEIKQISLEEIFGF